MNINTLYFSDNEPGLIEENSTAIKDVLKADELDAEKLLELVETREKLIVDFLNHEKSPDKLLLQDLLKTNEHLTALVEDFKGEQQGVLVGFLRTRKAVKKYKK